MAVGTVKWFNTRRAMGLFSHKAAAAKTCLSTFRQSKGLVCRPSTKASGSNTRRYQTRARHRPKTLSEMSFAKIGTKAPPTTEQAFAIARGGGASLAV